jgi:hypothetical protein
VEFNYLFYGGSFGLVCRGLVEPIRRVHAIFKEGHLFFRWSQVVLLALSAVWRRVQETGGDEVA